MNVLMVTSEWPTPTNPQWVPFLVREVRQLQAKGIELDVFSFRGGMRPLNYFAAWKKVQRRIRQGRYDLVHAQWGQSGLLATFPKPLPLVVTFRGSDLNGMVVGDDRMTRTGRLLQRLSQFVAQSADQVILVSASLARWLPRLHYHVIPSGLDLELFRPMPRAEARSILNLDQGCRYVLFAGDRSNPIKRFELAQRAVDLLNREMSAQLLVAERVKPEQMPAYMNAADALLLSSSREGSPNVVKEALACNLPVVSVDVGDVRQRLQDVAGCVVCDGDRPQTIAAALSNVLRAGRRVEGRGAVKCLDIRHTTEQIVQVYEKALTGAP